MRLRVRETADLLAAFPLHRQAAIFRKARVPPGAGEGCEVPGMGRYRSAEDIRVVIAVGGTSTYPPRSALDKGELPRPFKTASRQRLNDAPVKYFGPVCVACGKRYGQFIDHVQLSGLIRGSVCRDCNQVVERCCTQTLRSAVWRTT